MNYVKFYETENNLKVQKGYEVHHVDWNRENNDIENLVHIPKKVHVCIHNYFGYVTKEECDTLRKVYEGIENPERFTNQYLKLRLRKYISRKKCLLSKQIKGRLQHKQIEYSYNFR